ncbi:MAG: DEAD/DEAH box helicase [Hyphomicrobiaceae bacterium]
MAKLPRKFIYAFKAALTMEFGGDPKARVPEAARGPRGRFVGRLRRALAYTILTAQPPDLVILDEFQRYRDLLAKANRTDPLIGALFEPRSSPPGLLLLSATPYKLFATRLEENRGAEANREFFELLEFLGGASGAALQADAKESFAKFGNAILSIARAAPGSPDSVQFVEEARALRGHLQSMLAPYVSRMEREPTSDESAHTTPLEATLDAADIRAFRHLATSFKPEHAWAALPYWLSVPLPAQALGIRYQAWNHARRGGTILKDRSLVKLTVETRRNYSLPRSWPNPKLRALKDVTETEALALPWVRPSVPWWPLGGAWAQAKHESKLLVFSRFKATPQSVAALTSLRVEAGLLARTGGYDQVWKRRRLQAGPGRLPTIALFHPSPLLIRATDPLAVGLKSGVPRDVVRKQLIEALKGLKIQVIRGVGKKSQRRKPLWMLLSALERKSGDAVLAESAWGAIARGDQQLEDLLDDWHAKREIDWISGRELEDLVAAAMASPGVILGRALRRHFKDVLADRALHELVRLSWQGLRLYLDKPVFWAVMPKGKPVKVLQRACLQGNLEAVLDEHFWMRRQSLPTRELGLVQDLQEALNVSVGSFSFHSISPSGEPRIRVRCHAAVPFGSTEDEERNASGAAGEPAPPRSDEIRNAFNSPFWPHVLATTSVGQEGLDFHTWCSRILHWDLCSSPLELEQREGRIQRYAGLAVRRRLAALLQSELGDSIAGASSLWDRIEEAANARYRDASGLAPWWVLDGAYVERFVFNLSQSRDLDKFKLLKEQRLIYRLTLGQPNQEDLLEFLANGGPAVTALLKPLALDLSAFARTREETSNEPAERAAESPALEVAK